jgi:hypothetical protein
MMELLLALLIGFGGGWFLTPAKAADCRDEALVIASCPPPTELTDTSFGGHILKVQEQGAQYRECRAACVSH